MLKERAREEERDLRREEERILEAFKSIGYYELTDIQKKAIPVIVRRKNVLLVAPTGSGKTEAAIIPIFTLLKGNEGTKLLYITPLRALNRDIFRRIIEYGALKGLKIAIRHGDTTSKERKDIITNPPDVLITTPESLAIMLGNEKTLKLLKGIEWVVIDEIHELISNERGAHLSLSLARLDAISNHKIVRIGLSATLGDLKEGANFLAGYNTAILIDNSIREYDIDLIYKEGNINTIAQFIADYIKDKGNNILLFTNTRDEAEYLSTAMKSYANTNIDVHHGSLSRVVREETEQRLKEGNAGVVVTTSSLELGLDIGSIDLVIHYGSPRQVSKLAQRIGRSKHKKRLSAKGVIIINNKDDMLEAKAIIFRLKHRSIEGQAIHYLSLDVLAHHLVGLALEHERVNIEEAFNIIRKAYPFNDITIDDIKECLDILNKNNIIRLYDNYYKRYRSKKYYFENVSTIPDVLKFEVVDSISNKIIGNLDQEFVGDYGEKGNIFVLKGSQWRILAIDDHKLRITVEPVIGPSINIPYWVGELISVDYNTAKIVSRLRDKSYSINNIIPTSNRLVIESVKNENTIVIHSPLGNKINNTIAALLSTIISSKIGYLVDARADAYRILLTSSGKIYEKHIMDCLKDDYDLEPIIIASLNNTYNLNWRVWLVAKRFGLIDKKAIYDKKSAKLLYEKYNKSVIVREAIRELLHDKYDIKSSKVILDKIREGKVKVIWLERTEFSELAKPILEHTNRFSAMPLSIEQGIIEMVKERLENKSHKLICIRCANWEKIVKSKDTIEIKCMLCNSRLITATYVNDDMLSKIIKKRLKGYKLDELEEREFMRAWKMASLLYNFGRKALIVLSGYGVGVDTAARILRNCVDDSSIYKMVYEAEKQYITTRGFWND